MRLPLPFQSGLYCGNATGWSLSTVGDAYVSLGIGPWFEPGAIPHLFGISLRFDWMPELWFRQRFVSMFGGEFRITYPISFRGWHGGFNVVFRGRYAITRTW